MMRSVALLAVLIAPLCIIVESSETGTSYECTCDEWQQFQGADDNVPTTGITKACKKWTCQQHQSCFPADAFVRGEDGGNIRMADLSLGSKIHTAGSVDEVTNFIHREEALDAPFLRIRTDRGMLELSANHLAFVKSDGARRSVLAATVRVGDTLLHRDGDAQVTSIEPFKARGVYAPLTRTGELEVNGFTTSCYANIPSHAAAHAVMMPLHYLPANHDGIHWYAKAWMHMYEAGKWVLSKL